MAKRRLDALLVDRGLAPDREKAQALVMAGQVSVDERPAPKPGTLVEEDIALRVAKAPRYVGRGGEKLEHALDAFGLDVRGLVAADIGASTGGFTDCLLKRGARSVYAIDVGKGQLDYRLRKDRRVVVMEGLNAREGVSLPEPVDLVTVDISFISLRLVLPGIAAVVEGERRGAATEVPALEDSPILGDGLETDPGGCCAPTASARGSIIALFKPPFEAQKAEVPRGGVIRDAQFHAMLIGRFAAWCVAKGFRVLDVTTSPVLGAEGNREFFFWLRPAGARSKG